MVSVCCVFVLCVSPALLKTLYFILGFLGTGVSLLFVERGKRK